MYHKLWLAKFRSATDALETAAQSDGRSCKLSKSLTLKVLTKVLLYLVQTLRTRICKLSKSRTLKVLTKVLLYLVPTLRTRNMYHKLGLAKFRSATDALETAAQSDGRSPLYIKTNSTLNVLSYETKSKFYTPHHTDSKVLLLYLTFRRHVAQLLLATTFRKYWFVLSRDETPWPQIERTRFRQQKVYNTVPI